MATINTDIFGGCEGLITCFAAWLNEITSGMFWTVALMAFGIVLLLATFRFGFNRSFGFASFGVGAIGMFMFFLGLIPGNILALALTVSLIGIVMMALRRRL